MKEQAKLTFFPAFLICHLPLIEPTVPIEGITTDGLGDTDIGNKAALEGISRKFYQNIRKYYEQGENWKWQKRDDYKDGAQARIDPGEEAMRTFNPSAAVDLKNPYRSIDIAGHPLA